MAADFDIFTEVATLNHNYILIYKAAGVFQTLGILFQKLHLEKNLSETRYAYKHLKYYFPSDCVNENDETVDIAARRNTVLKRSSSKENLTN